MTAKYTGKKRKRALKGFSRWTKAKKKEIEELVVKLAKEGHSSAAIGTILRDRHGVPDVKSIVGKSVTDIMKEHGEYPDLPEDLLNLLKRTVNLRDHLERHKGDKHSKKGLERLESKIRKLSKYYKRKGILRRGWRYSPEEAKLIVQK